MSKEIKAIEFTGYIPPLASALTFGNETPRVWIDIDPKCREQAMALINMQEKKLRVLVTTYIPKNNRKHKCNEESNEFAES